MFILKIVLCAVFCTIFKKPARRRRPASLGKCIDDIPFFRTFCWHCFGKSYCCTVRKFSYNSNIKLESDVVFRSEMSEKNRRRKVIGCSLDRVVCVSTRLVSAHPETRLCERRAAISWCRVTIISSIGAVCRRLPRYRSQRHH
jgi:hypothetical protein